MRWRPKTKKLEKPISGQRRIRVKFAYFPLVTSDEFTVWLEKYLVEEEFVIPISHRVKSFPHWIVRDRWSKLSTMWAEWYGKI